MRALLAAMLLPSTALAQLGPGLGNRSWSAAELMRPAAVIQSPRGHGNVSMVQGYLMVIYSSDGGGRAEDGGIEFWDVSDPTAPRLVVRHDDARTHGLREAHGFSLARHEGRLLLAAQGVIGIQLWDVTDPMRIELLSYLDLPDIDRGDYSGDWWLFWQAPHVYVAGVDSGLFVVDATDPRNPSLVARMSTGQLGGVSPAQVFALGNLALVMESQGRDFASLDISVPERPRLLRQVAGRAGYSHVFAADGKILTSGNIPPRAHYFQVTPDGEISFLESVGLFLDSGGYGSYQDGFFHSGFSDDYQKFRIRPAEVVGSATSGRADRDEDFSTVLGNLVFVGDDHGVGSALVPHQQTPDTTPPSVEWMHPPSGSTGVALTSRVGLSFSDHIDASSLDDTTVRLLDAGGNAIPARLSAQMSLVNLAPIQELGLLATYTIVVDGLRDLAGNPAPRFTGTITTGDGSIAASPSASVRDVDVNIALGRYALGVFGAGKRVYSDRSYTFTQFPARFDGQAYLQTANVDKIIFLTDFLSFELLRPAEVLVLYDRRASARPNWMSGFTATGEEVLTTDTRFSAYSRRFPAGRVALGGNSAPGARGADSMYSVVIIPEPLPCTVDLAPVASGTVTLSAMGPSGGGFDWRIDGRPATGPAPRVYLAPGRHAVFLTVSEGPLRRTCGGVKIAHAPLAASAARVSSSIAWRANSTLNVNPDNGTVTRVDDAVIWETEVGEEPTALAVHGEEVFVVDRAEARLLVLSFATGEIARAIELPRASAPTSLVIDEAGVMYLTLSATGEVLRLAGGSVTRRPVTPTAHGLTLHAGKLYVTRFLSSDERGEVHVLDAATLEPRGLIPLAFDAGPDSEATGRGVPNYVAEVRIAPDGRTAYVASKKDNIARGLFRDGEPLTFETRVRAIVSEIDLAAGRESIAGRLDVNDRDLVQATLTSPLGDLLFVASLGTNTIDIFDTATRERVSQFIVDRGPRGLALDPGGRVLAIHNFLGRSVSYHDVSGLLAGTSNTVPELRRVRTVSRERLPPLALTGKRIFYDASDLRMSRDGYISCASCHLDGGEDARVWDFTQVGEGLRNTISLRGKGGLGHGRVHWTANFDEIQDFENDIRGGFGGLGFLSDTDFARTRDPLGPAKAGLSPELDAIAVYLGTLGRFPPSPHRAADGRLEPAAARGRSYFIELDCQRCHAGERFTDLLRHDVGTIRPSSGLGIGRALAGVGFDTPTLLGIFASAPYLHDGSAPTLANALERHGEIPALDPARTAELLAYLLSLDSSSSAPEGPCAECATPGDAGVLGDDAAAPDAPAADATSNPDAGLSTMDPVAAAPSGCGCRAADRGELFLAVLVALALRRRR